VVQCGAVDDIGTPCSVVFSSGVLTELYILHLHVLQCGLECVALYVAVCVAACCSICYWELCGKLQQFGTKKYKEECNRHDVKSIL